MRNTKSKIIIVMCILLCVMVVGYSAFNVALTITGTANIASEWKVVFTDISQVSKTIGATEKSTPVASGTSATFNVGLTSPGDKIEYKITIENQGNIDAIIENIKATETGNDAIIFNVTNIETGDTLLGKSSTVFNVTIEYNPNVTSQPSNLTNTLTISVNYIQYVGGNSGGSTTATITLSSKILSENMAYADNVSSLYVESSAGIDFSKISSDTNGKGLYYTSTDTEDGGTTYYFRGAVTNNYVKFGKDSNGNDILWRIVRINEDGSIRIVTQDSVGKSEFNNEHYDNAYMGYMYGETGQYGANAYNLTHSNDNQSVVKRFLGNWYATNLSSYSSYLADAGFCNDRSVASSAGIWAYNDTALGYGQELTIYGAYNRVYTRNAPQFKCPNASNDLFTTTTSSKGNKALTYPIGLLTADEVLYAGAIYTANNINMYLTNGMDYWTMSPFYFAGENTNWRIIINPADYFARGCIVDAYGNASYNYVSYERGVRPVINLKSTVTLSDELPSGCTSQNGTVTCPYIIKTN